MKPRKYKVRENVLSALLGVAISIPVSIGAYNSQSVSAYTIESVPLKAISREFNVEPIRLATPEVTTEPVKSISLGEFKITAYCSCSKCCGEWADGITYTETVARENHTIAVDPDVIELGSTVEINGVEYVAEDIGGAIKNNRIDMYFESHADALDWGVKHYEVYLVNN